ncbi:MAG: glutathione peroxidase [Balneola sp.]|nr:glutathione peroxidase [Balneola sp.]|tara:strand:- start:109 stop:651 length:543 start_codon:yes stop_codon:yes gene_type:complete
MKILSLLLISIMAISMNTMKDSIYDFKMKDIDGNDVSLSDYKGKVILIVNVASKCGFTSQYEGLQELYEAYKDEGFVILGFPANNFKGQEPGSNEEIKQFCTLEYGVEFPMFSKVSVKGDDQSDFFKYLTEQSNQDFEGDIKWNFEKFLISKDGDVLRRYRSNVEPMSSDIVDAIEKELN